MNNNLPGFTAGAALPDRTDRRSLPGFASSRAFPADRAVVPAAGIFAEPGPAYVARCHVEFDPDDPLPQPYLVCTGRYIWPGHPWF